MWCDLISRQFTVVSVCDNWPLIARVFYFSRAEAFIAYLLPLCIGARNVAWRLKQIHCKWVHTIFYGLKQHRRLALSNRQFYLALEDLGWRPLWDS